MGPVGHTVIRFTLLVSAALLGLQGVIVIMRGGFSHRFGSTYVALMALLTLALWLCLRLVHHRPKEAVKFAAWTGLLVISGMIAVDMAAPPYSFPVIVLLLVPAAILLRDLLPAASRTPTLYTFAVCLVIGAVAVRYSAIVEGGLAICGLCSCERMVRYAAVGAT